MKALYFEEHGERDVLQYGDLPDLKNKENHVFAIYNTNVFKRNLHNFQILQKLLSHEERLIKRIGIRTTPRFVSK